MVTRGVSRSAVLAVLATGEAIADYGDDTPYPSVLLLGWVEERPLHVVAAFDAVAERAHVITAYEPGPEHFAEDYRTRRERG